MKTIEECRANIQEFANKHKVIFEDNGEIGFGRECVGLIKDNSYIAYNPINVTTYDDIPEFFDDRLYDIAPEKAYHKDYYIAVLGRDEDSIRQLSDWIDSLKELNVTIEQYETGATGIQAAFSGIFGYSIKVPK